jgi:hypothetical protein
MNGMWLLLLLAAQDDSEVRDGKTYVSKSHGLTFSIPSKEWGAIKIGADIPPKWRWPGILAQFMDANQNVGGVLTAEPSKRKNAEYAEMFQKSLEKNAGSRSFKPTKDDPHPAFEGAFRRWYEWEYEKGGKKYLFTYVAVFHLRDKYNYKLVLWVEKKQWDAHKDAVAAILDSFKPLDGGGGEKEIVLPNPWQGCGKGSWAKYKMGETELKYTLVDQDADSYTITTDDGPPQKVALKVKVKDGDAPKTEEGEETIKVPKGEFKCKWLKTTTAQGWSKVWTSDGVPYRIVRQESEFGAVKSSMELVDFEKK